MVPPEPSPIVSLTLIEDALPDRWDDPSIAYGIGAATMLDEKRTELADVPVQSFPDVSRDDRDDCDEHDEHEPDDRAAPPPLERAPVREPARGREPVAPAAHPEGLYTGLVVAGAVAQHRHARGRQQQRQGR